MLQSSYQTTPKKLRTKHPPALRWCWGRHRIPPCGPTSSSGSSSPGATARAGASRQLDKKRESISRSLPSPPPSPPFGMNHRLPNIYTVKIPLHFCFRMCIVVFKRRLFLGRRPHPRPIPNHSGWANFLPARYFYFQKPKMCDFFSKRKIVAVLFLGLKWGA